MISSSSSQASAPEAALSASSVSDGTRPSHPPFGAGAPGAEDSSAIRPSAPPLDEAAETALARIRQRLPKADPVLHLPDVHPARIPRHVAIIMDGNGRWAEERGFSRQFGHRAGAISVRRVIEECGRLGIEFLTLYSFSSENWKRPKEEVEALMQLAVAYMEGEREALAREQIRVRVIGRREGLPAEVVAAIDAVEHATAHGSGPTLCVALNYGSRQEIVDAVRSLAARVARGELDPNAIDEAAFADALYTRGMPDPDLLVRTAGEMRVSNYLLWQISYAELYSTPTYWPDFDGAALRDAIRAYAKRGRRFGGL
ncbi:MAG: isoprenyl transferase [Planctomycetota bacterium]|nr:isoprenyl transferase [Planctomycetota bacterium]